MAFCTDTHICKPLKIIIAKNDNINEVEDSDFGVGDDDLFTGDDVFFYVFKNNKCIKRIIALNDYNLQTPHSNKYFSSSVPDTIVVLFDFSAMKKIKHDTAILINTIRVFNGDRRSLSKWTNSVKVKDIEIWYRKKCIGIAKLENTFKMEDVILGRNSIPIFSGSKDTLQLIIKNTYSLSNIKTGYYLSEIKFDGIKNY
jgi:hypothetical protein